MYLDTIAEQGRNFLYSGVFGFLLGLLFEVFEILGEFLPKKKIAFLVRDITYMMICTFLIFLFNLTISNGVFRFYVMTGIVIGWIAFYWSIGFILRSIREKISEFLKCVFKGFKKRIKKFSDKHRCKNAKKVKKSEISSDLLLQDDDLLLYNKKDNSQEKEV